MKIYLKVTCVAHGLAVDDGSYVPVSMLDPTMVRKLNCASS